MTTAEFEARAAFEVCRSVLDAREMGEIGTAALNYPEALTRAIAASMGGATFTNTEFAKALLRVARDVNQRKGLSS